jgi:SAM-dependent methyltransferase
MNLLQGLGDPPLVLLLRFRNRLLPWYARRCAENYESHRKNRRWEIEERVFGKLISQLAPKSVLDCPVGTGRWFPHYRAAGAAVTGVDLSEHMLQQAATAAAALDHVSLKQADVLDSSQATALGRDHDLIVCTRFVHWLREADIGTLAANFAATGSRKLLLGARVTRDEPIRAREDHSLRGLRRRIRGRLYRNITNHIHSESALLDIFRAHGWSLAHKERVLDTRSSRYFFYLFEATGRAG